jgi:hypothetical protein
MSCAVRSGGLEVGELADSPLTQRPEEIETDGAAWCASAAALSDLVMHPAMRLRLHDAVLASHRTHVE